jgi:hypothetical protein
VLSNHLTLTFGTLRANNCCERQWIVETAKRTDNGRVTKHKLIRPIDIGRISNNFQNY